MSRAWGIKHPHQFFSLTPVRYHWSPLDQWACFQRQSDWPHHVHFLLCDKTAYHISKRTSHLQLHSPCNITFAYVLFKWWLCEQFNSSIIMCPFLHKLRCAFKTWKWDSPRACSVSCAMAASIRDRTSEFVNARLLQPGGATGLSYISAWQRSIVIHCALGQCSFAFSL